MRLIVSRKPNLDGQVVVIVGSYALPGGPEQPSRAGGPPRRDVSLRLIYEYRNGAVAERLSGLRQFKHGDTWGALTFHRTGNSEVARLFRLWLPITDQPERETDVDTFLRGLIGRRCLLSRREFAWQGRNYSKDLVAEFL